MPQAGDAPLTQAQHRLAIRAAAAGFTDITSQIARWLSETKADTGAVTVFVRHTSASLTIQENADPDVLADLADALSRLAPRSMSYRHDAEGPDDMPAHIRAMLTATSLTIPVTDGRMVLGTWQGIYVIEHLDRARSREIVLHYVGTRRG